MFMKSARSRVHVLLLSLLLLWPAVAPAGRSSQALDEDNLSLILVGQVGGTTEAVYVEGDYAYIGLGSRLIVLDVSDPAHPTELGRTDALPGFVYAVQVVGEYAYVATGEGGLRVVSVADKAHPVQVSSCPAGFARGLDVEGEYAYVADSTWLGGGLHVISVADKSRPAEVSFFLAGGGVDVDVVGDYAYLAAGMAGGLRIISVADKSAPEQAGMVGTGNFVGVQVVGDYAYVASSCSDAGVVGADGMWIYDVADPANVTGVEYVTQGDAPKDVYVVGDYAYLADRYGDLHVISVTDKDDPTLVGSYDGPGSSRDLLVVGDRAYLANSGAGLRILSVANEDTPSELGFFDAAYDANDVDVVGDYAYVAAGTDGFRVISLTDRRQPVDVGSLETACSATGVHMVDGYAYVAAGGYANRSCGLHIISVGDKADPSQVGFYEMRDAVSDMQDPHDVQVIANYAYVADGWGGLRIISVADRADPALVGSYDPSPSIYALRLHVVDDYAYVADSFDGLYVISVADKNSPSRVGFYEMEFPAAEDVFVSDEYAYTIDRGWPTARLAIISVADKANPTEVGSYDEVGNTLLRAVHVLGDKAYLAAGNGLHVVSVADKANPSKVAYFDTVGTPRGVDAEDSYVYVADGYNGLVVLRLTSDVFGLTLSPTSDGKSGTAGASVAYSLQVTNTGNTSDTFEVTVSGNSWTTTAPRTVGPISAGASTNVDVTVSIPAGAASGASDTVTVTLSSRGDSTKCASSVLTTTATPTGASPATPPSGFVYLPVVDR